MPTREMDELFAEARDLTRKRDAKIEADAKVIASLVDALNLIANDDQVCAAGRTLARMALEQHVNEQNAGEK